MPPGQGIDVQKMQSERATSYFLLHYKDMLFNCGSIQLLTPAKIYMT
jgi:hypothetical protein